MYGAFPHIATNDERAKEIRLKALSYSSIVVLVTLAALGLPLFLNPTLFTALELLQVITTFMIVTQSSMLVFMTKKI